MNVPKAIYFDPADISNEFPGRQGILIPHLEVYPRQVAFIQKHEEVEQIVEVIFP